jgi:hypothetical protein
MMKKYIPIICLILCTLSATSCRKLLQQFFNPFSPSSAPECSCVINGTHYRGTARNPLTPGVPRQYMHYYYSRDVFFFDMLVFLYANDENGKQISSFIRISYQNKEVPSVGKEYRLDSTYEAAFYRKPPYCTILTYGVDSLITSGYLRFDQLDLINGNISGAFKFRGIDRLNDSINVTDGLFFGKELSQEKPPKPLEL